jgi:hypothetical protein
LGREKKLDADHPTVLFASGSVPAKPADANAIWQQTQHPYFQINCRNFHDCNNLYQLTVQAQKLLPHLPRIIIAAAIPTGD